jgi:hypothetical protein
MNPFWGWSSLAYVMPLDLEMHYDPMDLEGTIRPLITEQWGLRWNDGAAAKPQRVRMELERTLHAHLPKSELSHEIPTSKNRLAILALIGCSHLNRC